MLIRFDFTVTDLTTDQSDDLFEAIRVFVKNCYGDNLINGGAYPVQTADEFLEKLNGKQS